MIWLINDLTRCFNYELRNVDGTLSWTKIENNVQESYDIVEEDIYIQKGVSEPVISFVEEFKRNKKRFITRKHWCRWTCRDKYWVYDEKCKLSYVLAERRLHLGGYTLETTPSFKDKLKIKNQQDLSWLTQEELNYIYKELIEKWDDVRRKRFKELKEIRQRRKLKKLYVKEEK